MPHEESCYPADWMRIAEKDFRRAASLLDRQDIELAAFCLQQALEKFLKAFLLSKGWQLQRIHSLGVLLDHAVEYDPTLEQFRDVCQHISVFYLAERYPFLEEPAIDEADVRASLSDVEALVDRLRASVKEH